MTPGPYCVSKHLAPDKGEVGPRTQVSPTFPQAATDVRSRSREDVAAVESVAAVPAYRLHQGSASPVGSSRVDSVATWASRDQLK